MSDKKIPSKPGEAALENMKLLKKESYVFKVPQIPTKKRNAKRSTVLDEELYVQVNIIFKWVTFLLDDIDGVHER